MNRVTFWSECNFQELDLSLAFSPIYRTSANNSDFFLFVDSCQVLCYFLPASNLTCFPLINFYITLNKFDFHARYNKVKMLLKGKKAFSYKNSWIFYKLFTKKKTSKEQTFYKYFIIIHKKFIKKSQLYFHQESKKKFSKFEKILNKLIRDPSKNVCIMLLKLGHLINSIWSISKNVKKKKKNVQ